MNDVRERKTFQVIFYIKARLFQNKSVNQEFKNGLDEKEVWFS